MEIALFIYLAGFVGKLGFLLMLVTYCAILALAVHIIWCSDYKKTFQNKFLIVPLLTAFLWSTVPSEKTMYLMASGYAAQKVTTAVVESDIAKDVLTVLELKVKEQIKELKPKE